MNNKIDGTQFNCKCSGRDIHGVVHWPGGTNIYLFNNQAGEPYELTKKGNHFTRYLMVSNNSVTDIKYLTDED